MSNVSLIKCNEYELDKVYDSVKKAVDLLGGIEKFVKKDSKVFIKLNCIGPFTKEMGITTHPVFTEAVVKLVLTQTSNITIGDNPGSRDIESVLKKNGNMDVINKYNLKIFNGKDKTTIHNTNYKVYSNFEVSKEYIDCDTMINLPKLKTHTLTYMTGAQKNYFGLIYGFEKASWHTKAPNPLVFSEALNDLYGAYLESMKDKTILNICDGILALDGDGPSTGGYPVKVGAITCSTDALAVDIINCKIVKLDESRLIITNEGLKRGFSNKNEINLLGDKLEDFNDIKFNGPKSQLSSIGLRIIRKKVFRNLLLSHPLIDHSKCIKCGECTRICPEKTMVITPGAYPHLTAKNCIRCWCCAEVCPKDAIKKTKTPILGKIFLK